MLGLNGNPYIGLDRFLNVDVLDVMKSEIAIGVALSEHILGYYGRHRFVNPDNPNMPPDGVDLYDRDYSEIDQKLIDTMDYNRAMIFSSLKYGITHMGPIIYLRKPTQGYPNRVLYAENTPNAGKFPSLINWVKALPVKKIGRLVLYYSPPGSQTMFEHADQISETHEVESIWVKLIGDKRFYVFDSKNHKKHYVDSRCVLFNPSDYHGVDPSETPTVSMRVDVCLNDEIRKKINLYPPYFGNPN